MVNIILKRPRGFKGRKRTGRGGKRGTYSGKGVKGQKARSGRKFQPLIRQIIKRYHKLRGYEFNPFKEKPVVLNLSDLEGKIPQKVSEISPRVLVNLGIVEKVKGKIPRIKILARGEIKKKLIVKGIEVSDTAAEKIEKAGGKVIE